MGTKKVSTFLIIRIWILILVVAIIIVGQVFRHNLYQTEAMLFAALLCFIGFLLFLLIRYLIKKSYNKVK